MNEYATARRRWKRWLVRLRPDVAGLATSIVIFRRYREIVEENQAIQKPDLFHRWVFTNFSLSVAVRIRRLLEAENKHRRRQVVSLYRLIQDVMTNEGGLTRRSYVSSCSPDSNRSAHRKFDEDAGIGASFLPATRAKSDLVNLERAHVKVKRFVNKYGAHLDHRNLPAHRNLRYEDLFGAYDEIETKFRKYHRLITGRDYVLPPLGIKPFEEIFYQPWCISSKESG